MLIAVGSSGEIYTREDYSDAGSIQQSLHQLAGNNPGFSDLSEVLNLSQVEHLSTKSTSWVDTSQQEYIIRNRTTEARKDGTFRIFPRTIVFAGLGLCSPLAHITVDVLDFRPEWCFHHAVLVLRSQGLLQYEKLRIVIVCLSCLPCYIDVPRGYSAYFKVILIVILSLSILYQVLFECQRL